jgi:multidrug efflux pump subunit AcrB
MKELLLIAVVLALIVLGPFATIWAMNTLFPALAIPYNLDTWCAVILLKGFAITTISRNK